MTFKDFSNCLLIIQRILKKKYTNLSTEEATTIASEILNSLIDHLDIKQE